MFAKLNGTHELQSILASCRITMGCKPRCPTADPASQYTEITSIHPQLKLIGGSVRLLEVLLLYSLLDHTQKIKSSAAQTLTLVFSLQYHNHEIWCSPLSVRWMFVLLSCNWWASRKAQGISWGGREVTMGAAKGELEQNAINKVYNQVLNTKCKYLLTIHCPFYVLNGDLKKFLTGNICSCNSQAQVRKCPLALSLP